MKKLKAKGRRGSWFAEVDGQVLPCVHNHWLNKLGYHDPHACPGEPKWDEFIEAIARGKRVILTSDKVLDGAHVFERTGYIAVFDIAEVVVDGSDLRFRLTKRVAELV